MPPTDVSLNSLLFCFRAVIQHPGGDFNNSIKTKFSVLSKWKTKNFLIPLMDKKVALICFDLCLR